MRSRGFVFGIFLFIAVILMCGTDAQAKGFAVVELFASEGCSSCPAADVLLSKIIQQSKEQRLPVYALSFEVDYWNYMGWKDRFSSPLFTERQGQYVFVLKAKSSYTPQMVINGQKEFVGSDERSAWQHINAFLLKSAADSIKLNVAREGVATIKVQFQVSRVAPHTAIQIALVQSGVESRPNAGENEGLLLKHDHVVINFQTIALAGSKGETFFELPAGADPKKFMVIAYVQDLNDMKILSATESTLNK